MPFPYQSSAVPVRTRRPRDKDNRNATSSSGRKPKEVSRSSTRTPPQTLRPAQPSLYAQQNLTLDQLPALPGSGTVSPAVSSPVLEATSCIPEPTTALISSAHLHTPAALQPYLDHDEHEDEDDEPSFTTVPEPKTSPNGTIPEANASPENKQPSTSIQSAPQDLVSQPLESLTTIPPTSPSPKSVETAVYRLPTPPPLAPSPLYGPRPPGPGPLDLNQPYSQPKSQSYSQPLVYLNSPPPFAPAVPYLPGPPSEHYYPPPYGGPAFMPMTHPSGNSTDLQNLPSQIPPYFTHYSSPQQVQAPFHSMRSSSTRGRSSIGSRRSFSGEPFPSMPSPLVNPPEQALFKDGSVPSPQEKDDDVGNLLQRLQSAIPDLHLLMNRCQETSDQLEVRKSIIRETEAQKAAALKQKETYIERLGRELETISSKHTAESSKLRLEIGNMEEKHKELQDSLLAEKKVKQELEATNRALRAEKENTERKLTEEKHIMARDIQIWREKESKEFAGKQNAFEMELQRQKQESETKLQVREAEVNQRYALEKEELQTGWSRQRQELEDSHARLRRDLESALEARQQAVDEAHRKQLQDREAWNKEREALSYSWGEERNVLGKGSEEQRTFLAAQHQNEKDGLQKKWQASQSRAIRLAEEATLRLQKENERLRAGWDADKTRFAKATGELRSVAIKLNEDNIKLQKLAEAFGEVTDLKSREDPFYDDAFHHLYKQISDLTIEHFSDDIGNPPESVVKTIPQTIPPFCSNTESSIKLRAAYVEHLISKIISRRIFQPFLFTISLRHGSPDLLFQHMSDHLRKKSTRREALWRQRTLHAAYTISSAKQSINKIAAFIVDEVVEAIKYFSNPTRWEQVTVAVRRIVKTAAETWRYARLEVAMITASMSTDEQPDYQRLSNPIGPDADTAGAPDQRRSVLLSLFPIIEREAIHEDIRADSKQNDRYIYFPGRMLYSDDPMISTRRKEIQQNDLNHVHEDTEHQTGQKRSPQISGGALLKAYGAESNARSPPLGSRTRSDPELNGPSSTLPINNDSCVWEEIDMSSTSAAKRQLHREAKRKFSGGSRSQASTMSHSSGRSASSDARSSSTTRPATLPNWNRPGENVPRAGPGVGDGGTAGQRDRMSRFREWSTTGCPWN